MEVSRIFLGSTVAEMFPILLFFLLFAALSWFQRRKIEDVDSSDPLQGQSAEKSLPTLEKMLNLPKDAPSLTFQRPSIEEKKSFVLPPLPVSSPLPAKVGLQKLVKGVQKLPLIHNPSLSHWLKKEVQKEPGYLRRAIILKEILGSPRGLK